MSAILAVIGDPGTLPADPEIRRMLDAMASRGTELVAVHREADAVLAAGAFRWESASRGGTSAPLFTTDELVVVADATLYHTDELAARLREAGFPPAGPGACQLIAAAYRAWGSDLTDALEGDYAFLIWDRRRRILIGERDFVGSRPLHHASAGGALVAASSLGAVLAMPGVPSDLNLPALALTLSFQAVPERETVYRAVRVLPAGHRLEVAENRSVPTASRVWRTPRFLAEARPRIAFNEAAEELRRLLFAATEERLGLDAPTSITLSGGWDSPAVYAAAHAVSRRNGSRAAVVPISISFPDGDSGREDETIALITGRYGQEPQWLDICEIPLFEPRFEEDAAAADDPFSHVFSGFNRAPARIAAGLGARTVLNGAGGDHLFHAERGYLSDLLRSGRILRFGRELAAEGMVQRGELAEWVVRPLLSPSIRRAIGKWRGGATPLGYLQRSLPPWLDPEFVERNELRARVDREVPARPRSCGAEEYEHRWMFEHPFYARTLAAVHAIGLQEGVEQRSPLLDRRIVEFAATRPRAERRSRRETKRLLRASMSGLLPDAVLAPREARTGTMVSYFHGSMATSFGPRALPWLREPLLAELGIVDRDRLHRSCSEAERGMVGPYGGALVMTLRMEIWLRARLGRIDQEHVRARPDEQHDAVPVG
jgi:asparagine synthase (glutamine-hydrolysing)